MTDTSGTLAPQEPNEQQPGAEQEPAGEQVEYKVHPSWEEPLAVLPENLRGPIIEKIRSDERNVQKQIEQARAAAAPEEWREFIAEAQKGQVTPAEVIEAYNDNQELVERLNTDPWGFLDQLSANIDAAVAAGQISAREGAALKKEGAAVAAGAAEELADDDPYAERFQKVEQELAQERQARQQEAQQRQVEAERAEAEEIKRTFISSFDEVMVASGFATMDNGRPRAIIAPDTINAIAATADQILDANPSLTPRQAIEQSVERLRQVVAAAGGSLPSGPAAAPAVRQQIPVGGGSASTVAPAASTGFKSKAEREAAMIAALQELNGDGAS